MRAIYAVSVACCVASCPVMAADSWAFSDGLAIIVGSSETCGFALSDDAVSVYAKGNVPPSDLEFAKNLDMQTGFYRREIAEMSGLELRLRCEAVLRSAEHLKLLAP